MVQKSQMRIFYIEMHGCKYTGLAFRLPPEIAPDWRRFPAATEVHILYSLHGMSWCSMLDLDMKTSETLDNL